MHAKWLSVVSVFFILLNCSAALALEGRSIPQATNVLAATFTQHVTGKYFTFHSNIPRARLALYAHFSDMFVELIDRDFFKVKTRFPIHAFILEDKKAFKAFLEVNYKVPELPEYGIFFQEAGTFITYDDSGLGTLAHEIMHPLVEESLPARPLWAGEGIPAFFEKFYGYESGNRLEMNWGHQNPWRIEHLGPRLKTLKLIRIVYGSENTSEKRLLTVFLYQRGKFKHFIEMIQADDKKGFRTFLEATFEKPLLQIQDDWEIYLKEVEANRAQIMKLPASRIFDTPAEYQEFRQQFGL